MNAALGSQTAQVCTGHLNAVTRLLDCLPARNEAQQDSLDRIKLGAVDERVGADVEEGQEQHAVVAALEQSEGRVDIYQQVHVNVHWQVADGIECAHKDHGLGDVYLHLIGLHLMGV